MAEDLPSARTHRVFIRSEPLACLGTPIGQNALLGGKHLETHPQRLLIASARFKSTFHSSAPFQPMSSRSKYSRNLQTWRNCSLAYD